MCKPKKPKAPKVPEPVYMTNPILDRGRGDISVAMAARTGRSSLRIPLDNGLGIGFSGRQSLNASTLTRGPGFNASPAPRPTVQLRPGGIPA